MIAPLPGQSAAVVLYNLKHPSPAEPVQGKISLGDYKNAAALLNGNAAEAYASIPAEGIAAWMMMTRLISPPIPQREAAR